MTSTLGCAPPELFGMNIKSKHNNYNVQNMMTKRLSINTFIISFFYSIFTVKCLS